MTLEGFGNAPSGLTLLIGDYAGKTRRVLVSHAQAVSLVNRLLSDWQMSHMHRLRIKHGLGAEPLFGTGSELLANVRQGVPQPAKWDAPLVPVVPVEKQRPPLRQGDCPDCLGDGLTPFSLYDIEDGLTPDTMPPCDTCNGTGFVAGEGR